MYFTKSLSFFYKVFTPIPTFPQGEGDQRYLFPREGNRKGGTFYNKY